MTFNLGSEKIGKVASILLVLLISAILVAGCTASSAEPLPAQPRLRVATTTSLYDTGLWGYLEPMFEEQYEVELDVMCGEMWILLPSIPKPARKRS